MKKVLAIVLLTFAPLPAAFAKSTAPSLPADSSQQEQNKAIARRVFEEIFNQGKFQVADEIYAKDFVNHGLHRNIDLQEDQAAARWLQRRLRRPFTSNPDLSKPADLNHQPRSEHYGLQRRQRHALAFRRPDLVELRHAAGAGILCVCVSDV